MLMVQRALNFVWQKNKDLDKEVDLSQPIMYVDQGRFRNSGDTKFAKFLPPHTDSGLVQKLKDPIQRFVNGLEFSVFNRFFLNMIIHD